MTENIVALIGIGITLIISIITLIFSVLSSKKTIYVNTVTTLRSKWLDQMKSDLSEFIALISDSIINNRNIYEPKEMNLKYDLERIYRKIELNINPNDEYDRKLISMIKNITRNYDCGAKNQRIKENIEELVLYTQKITKLEWEGIKLESINGVVSKKEKKKLINKYLEEN